MLRCEERAVLIVTHSVEGTSTNVVRERIELRCDLASGHEGAHEDSQRKERWEGAVGRVATVLRHENE